MGWKKWHFSKSKLFASRRSAGDKAKKHTQKPRKFPKIEKKSNIKKWVRVPHPLLPNTRYIGLIRFVQGPHIIAGEGARANHFGGLSWRPNIANQYLLGAFGWRISAKPFRHTPFNPTPPRVQGSCILKNKLMLFHTDLFCCLLLCDKPIVLGNFLLYHPPFSQTPPNWVILKSCPMPPPNTH